MKIIQISASYKPAYIYGGPIMSVAKLCEALVETEEQKARIKEQGAKSKERDLKVEVFTTTANGENELAVDTKTPLLVDGVNVRYFKRLTKDHTHFSPALLWALRQDILTEIKEQGTRNKEQILTKGKQRATNNEQRTTNNDLIIHIHAWWNLVSLLSCLVAKWYKIPVLLSPRGMLTSYTLGNRNSFSKRLIHSLIGKRLLQYCHIHATSEKEKEDIVALILAKSVTVIPNLVELEEVPSSKFEIQSRERQITINERQATIDEKRTSNNETFKLIFLSRVEEKKGLDLLFEALAELKFDWSLTIAGSGDESYVKNLKRKSESSKLDKRINWVGQIDKKEKFKLLEEHDLLVLTSYNENFANVVIESLSVGTAVLISKEVGLYDYVQKNNFGWITSINKNSILNNLEQATMDTEKLTTIRSLSPKIVRNDFSKQTLINGYLKIYHQLTL
ncbi:MAG: glycosyltransferase [Pedobacter sp.]|nr:MAG: glycosyltransferase [Pedobacter sp.]